MDTIQYRSIDEVAEVLQDMKSRRRGCSLLIGAGASFAAGIPTAAGFVQIIKERYKYAYARAINKTYAKCMAELLLSQRRDLIAQYVDNAKINWAHVGIALLMREGYIDRVLTTNFDLLVVRACALLGVFPAIYDFAASQLLKHADLPDQAVFYLHGQRTGFVLMNTSEDMESHSKLLGPVFDDAGNGRTWIVVGYSGENDPVFEHLARQPKFDNGLFWVGYGDREPQAHVREKLLSTDKDAFFTKGYDADSFFISLTRALDVFPPDLVAKPFTYVKRALEQLTSFVQPGQTNEEDVMGTPNKWIQSAIEQFEKPAWELITRVKAVEDELTDQSVIENVAQYLSMKGDYERVIGFRNEYEKSPSPELADLISKAFVARGNQLLDQAKEIPSLAKKLFVSAKEMYEAALAISPNRHEALHNWANFLLDLAKASESSEAEEYFTEAESKYASAFALKPDQPEILINWGNMLLDRAKAGVQNKSSKLFAEAEEKYRAAIRINPNMPAVRYSLGNLLLDQAKAVSGHQSETLFTAAEDQYKAAIALNPDMAEAFYQWGNVFLDRAKRSHGGDQQAQFQGAIEKFHHALVIRPDMHQALNNWGSLLADYGKTKDGNDLDRLFDQANERYHLATAMKPDFYEAWNNWGNLLLDWRKRKDGSQAELLFKEAQEKYSIANRLRPDAPEPLDNWGNLLLDQAKTKSGSEADQIFEAAYEKYAAAWAVRPSMYQVLNNWGNCLSDQARRKEGDEAQSLFSEAEKKYSSALALSGKNLETIGNFASMMVDSGRSLNREEAIRSIVRTNELQAGG
jgi:tetratricopeptide (TPR) repeat protein